MQKAKAAGARGSWFAEVDGERLPCVHKYWWKNGRYDDTGLRAGPKADELVDAIRSRKRVILTDDIPEHDSQGRLTGFTRNGYIAVYSVDEVDFDDSGLRFRFIKRLLDLA